MSTKESSSAKETILVGPRWAINKILKVIGWIVLLLVLLMVIWAGYFMYNAAKTGTAQTIGENIYVALSNTFLGPFVEQIGLKAVLYTQKPSTIITEDSSFQAQVDKNEENPNLGVHINKFYPKSKVFTSGEPITFTAEINAQSFKDDASVNFDCKLEDYNNEDYGLGEAKIPSKGDSNDITINKNTNSQLLVTCEFPQGIIISGNKDIIGKKSMIEAVYDFETNAYVKTYFLNKEKYDSFISNSIDPFDYYGIKDSQNLNSDNTALPHYSDGPVKLSINSKQTQPLTKGTKYLLEVKIANREDYGIIDKLDSLTIELSDKIKLVEDISCDFVSTGEKTEKGLNVYKITEGSNILKRINTDCSLSALFGKDITVEDCISRYKSQATFQCWFNIEGDFSYSSSGEGISYDMLRATARYSYKTSKSSVANIEKAL